MALSRMDDSTFQQHYMRQAAKDAACFLIDCKPFLGSITQILQAIMTNEKPDKYIRTAGATVSVIIDVLTVTFGLCCLPLAVVANFAAKFVERSLVELFLHSATKCRNECMEGGVAMQRKYIGDLEKQIEDMKKEMIKKDEEIALLKNQSTSMNEDMKRQDEQIQYMMRMFQEQEGEMRERITKEVTEALGKEMDDIIAKKVAKKEREMKAAFQQDMKAAEKRIREKLQKENKKQMEEFKKSVLEDMMNMMKHANLSKVPQTIEQ